MHTRWWNAPVIAEDKNSSGVTVIWLTMIVIGLGDAALSDDELPRGISYIAAQPIWDLSIVK